MNEFFTSGALGGSMLLQAAAMLGVIRSLRQNPLQGGALGGASVALFALTLATRPSLLGAALAAALSLGLLLAVLGAARQSQALRASEEARRSLEKALVEGNEQKDWLSRALKLRRTLDHLLRQQKEEGPLFRDLCQAIVEIGVFRLAWIGEGCGRRIIPLARGGYEKGYLETLCLSTSEHDGRGRGPTGTAYRTGRVAVVQNVMTDPCFAPWREQALERGYGAVISLPLNVGARRLVLTIYAVEPQTFDRAEIEWLSELSEVISEGLRRLMEVQRVGG